jgi:adenine-specific DNA-methyltransferase
MIDVARQMRAAPTPGEELLWDAIRNRKLDGRKFRRQQPIGGFVVDFYYAEENLAVEVDGSIHRHRAGHDAERQSRIEATGVRFVRIAEELVQGDLHAALDAIRSSFTQAPSLRRLEGGGGEEAVTEPQQTNESNHQRAQA